MFGEMAIQIIRDNEVSELKPVLFDSDSLFTLCMGAIFFGWFLNIPCSPVGEN